MSDIHVTREILKAVAGGDLPPSVLTQIGWEHLIALCPHCREEYEAWRRERAPAASYDSAFRVIPLVLERQNQDLEQKREMAKKNLRALLKLRQPARLIRIQRSTGRFRGLTLARMLLDEAKKNMPATPATVYDLAEAAYEVLLRTPERPGINDLLARAMAFMGNTLRAAGDLPRSERRIASARSIIRQCGVTDLIVYAEVDHIEGALRKDQRRFPEAEDLLVRAAALYNLAGEGIEAARVLVSLGLMYYDQQELAKAAEVTQAALIHLTPEIEPRLFLCARHNLALFLCESGSYGGAAEALLVDEELYQTFSDSWTKLRQAWLTGKIAYGFGRLDEAERAFLATREGFVAQGNGYDTAMASLDLALVYLKQGRSAELKQLAEEMYPIFEAQDVHREAAAALVLFQEAARQETLTIDLVQDLASYLKRARDNPELRFQ